MQLLHSRNSWVYRQDFSKEIDFCIWVLENDGLRVPPFDQHPDGDGLLRMAGLNGESWQSWLIRVVALQYQHDQQLQKLHRSVPPTPADVAEFKAILTSEAHKPATAWTENSAVGERLAILWEQYQPIADERKKLDWKQSHKRQQLEIEQHINLWQDLRPYHARIPTLSIYTVYYAQPLNYLIAPITVLMTFSDRQPDLPGFRERLIDAAAGLSAATTARKRVKTGYIPSSYTPPNQTIPLYKTFAHKLMPPPTIYPKVHIVAENELKQLVLDNLENHPHAYEDINLASVQFLREKAIPCWQLYYVSFEEFDGHKHTCIVQLQQNEDGSWRFRSYSSVSNLADAVAQFGIKIYDHPIISLSGGKGDTARDKNPYEFVAYGEIIDNGFDVTRVRLLNDDGQSFEDTVEDGLVFFATTQDHEVKWPMQAELYNKAGELVWRETVLDNRPPSWLKLRH